VLKTIGQHSEGQGLDVRNRVVSALPVDQHAGKIRNFGDPATVVLALKLDLKVQAVCPIT